MWPSHHISPSPDCETYSSKLGSVPSLDPPIGDTDKRTHTAQSCSDCMTRRPSCSRPRADYGQPHGCASRQVWQAFPGPGGRTRGRVDSSVALTFLPAPQAGPLPGQLVTPHTPVPFSFSSFCLDLISARRGSPGNPGSLLPAASPSPPATASTFLSSCCTQMSSERSQLHP